MTWDDKSNGLFIISAKINGRRGIRPTKLDATNVVIALKTGFIFSLSITPVFSQ